MSKYIFLENADTLPFLDNELFFIDPYQIILTSHNKDSLLSNIDTSIKNKILIGWGTGESVSYPRFNLTDYIYKVRPNNKINILPNNERCLDTETLFDNRSIELLQLSEQYKNVYIFWSGGIDSTLILSSILKNWVDTRKIVVVLNKFSIEEHSNFYEKFIKNKLTTVDTDCFFNIDIRFDHNNLYVTGDLGDPLITFDGYDDYDRRYPNSLNQPWKAHTQSIIDYYRKKSNNFYASFVFVEILKTSKQAGIKLETVHDFLWWVNFNWGYDTDIVYMLWQYQDLDQNIDTKRFLETNVFYWFNSQDCQNWAMSLIGTDLRDRNGIFKYAFKKYIYDFDKDDDYFKYKGKEISTPKNLQVFKNKQILAVDTDYNMYYRNIKILPKNNTDG